MTDLLTLDQKRQLIVRMRSCVSHHYANEEEFETEYQNQYFYEAYRQRLLGARHIFDFVLSFASATNQQYSMPHFVFHDHICAFNQLLDTYIQQHQLRKTTLQTFKNVLILNRLMQSLCFVQREVVMLLLERFIGIPSPIATSKSIALATKNLATCFEPASKLMINLPKADIATRHMKREFAIFKGKLDSQMAIYTCSGY